MLSFDHFFLEVHHKDRPTEFSSKPGSEHILVTFERVKAK